MTYQNSFFLIPSYKCNITTSYSIWYYFASVKLPPPPARLGCLCCDDPALPGDPLPPLVVEQVQVRGHHAQEGWVKTVVPSTRDIQWDLQETIDSVKWPIPEHFVPVLLCTIGYSSDITRVFSVLVHVTEDSKYQSRLPIWHTFWVMNKHSDTISYLIYNKQTFWTQSAFEMGHTRQFTQIYGKFDL